MFLELLTVIMYSCSNEQSAFICQQDRLSAVQMELEEERQNGDLLLERIDRGREQVRSS